MCAIESEQVGTVSSAVCSSVCVYGYLCLCLRMCVYMKCVFMTCVLFNVFLCVCVCVSACESETPPNMSEYTVFPLAAASSCSVPQNQLFLSQPPQLF